VITTADPIDLDTLRIRHAFLAAADLRVSVDGVAAMYGIAPRHAQVALESLVWAGFLERTRDGQYVRSSGAQSN
jgi:predicted transcriptional regulator of viral defense system